MNFTSEIEELIYNEYLEIPVSDYHGKTHYFERNIREINQLPFDLSIEIRCACVIAYFELGLYYKYLNQVDDLIHLVITENIYELNGKNIFEELITTYHIYYQEGYKLKETHWFLMSSDYDKKLTLQIEEGITAVGFKNDAEISEALKNTYANIKLVYDTYKER